MRSIELKTIDNVSTAALIKEFAQSPGDRGVLIDEIRLRLRLVDAVDEAVKAGAPAVLLEDADYHLLERLIKTFPFARVTHPVLEIADGILAARTAPAPVVASIRDAG